MRWLALATAVAITACTVAPSALAPSSTPTASAAAVLAPVAPVTYDGTRAKAHLDYLADPARGGRFTASPGYADAARYMADRFRDAGLEPYGDDGTYFQTFTMPLVDLAATPVLEIAGGRAFEHRVEFTESVGGTAGSGSGEGRVVFGATGSRSAGSDDLNAVDVRDAIVMLVDPASDAGQNLARGGAKGALIVSDRMLKFSYIPRFERSTIPILIVTEAAANAILAPTGSKIADLRARIQSRRSAGTGAALSFTTDVRARMSVPLTPVRQVEATNIVGLLRGSDASLSKTAVLVGGHLDGFGTYPSGAVFQAANDNASGPAVLAELARALAPRRAELRRSVIFIAFAAEEQGLFGSEHYASQVSAIPGRPESLVAFINLDVVGCCGSVLGASDDSPELRKRIVRAAEAERVFDLGTFRGSSDHASFARRRVEVVQIGWTELGPIHTVRDVASAVTAERLAIVGRVTARAILDLGGS